MTKISYYWRMWTISKSTIFLKISLNSYTEIRKLYNTHTYTQYLMSLVLSQKCCITNVMLVLSAFIMNFKSFRYLGSTCSAAWWKSGQSLLLPAGSMAAPVSHSRLYLSLKFNEVSTLNIYKQWVFWYRCALVISRKFYCEEKHEESITELKDN